MSTENTNHDNLPKKDIGPYHPVFPGMQHEPVKTDQTIVPTYGLIGFLIVFFFILKLFIYIKDEKRDGK